MTIIGGRHTVAELAALLSERDASVAALSDARDRAEASGAWASVDPVGWQQWTEGVDRFLAYYGDQTKGARNIIRMTADTAAAATPAEPSYRFVSRAFHGADTRPGFDALCERLRRSPDASVLGSYADA